MGAAAKTRLAWASPDEYLRDEQLSETRNEYVDGVIVAMAGNSVEHLDIDGSILVALDGPVRAAGCHAFSSNMLVRIKRSNRYYYPDYVVHCGKPEFELRQGLKCLLNPVLIIEVLSTTTAHLDRGEKRAAYCEIASLTTYVLVHQDRPLVELFYRAPGTRDWQASAITGLGAILPLSTIGAELPLSTIYRDVVFGEEPEEPESSLDGHLQPG